jgi:glycogen operon protein
MDSEQWNEAYAHALTIFLSGHAIEHDARGELVTDDDVLWMVNASADDIVFTVPPERWGSEWELAIDTATGEVSPLLPIRLAAGATVKVTGRSTIMFIRARGLVDAEQSKD